MSPVERLSLVRVKGVLCTVPKATLRQVDNLPIAEEAADLRPVWRVPSSSQAKTDQVRHDESEVDFFFQPIAHNTIGCGHRRLSSGQSRAEQRERDFPALIKQGGGESPGSLASHPIAWSVNGPFVVKIKKKKHLTAGSLNQAKDTELL